MIETPSAGAPQSPWWYRNRSSVFGVLYGLGFGVPSIVNDVTNSPYVPTIVPLGRLLGGGGAVDGLFYLAVFFMFLCFGIRWWGSSYLQSIVWSADAKAVRLFVEGPFRYTRNPLYFGNVFMSLGFALIAPPAGAAFIIIANAALIDALIRHEEPLLRAQFGEAYKRYCATVPRFWPRLRPVSAEGDLKPSYVKGFFTETFTLSFALGMCCFFAPAPYGFYGFLAFYAFGIMTQRFFARRFVT